MSTRKHDYLHSSYFNNYYNKRTEAIAREHGWHGLGSRTAVKSWAKSRAKRIVPTSFNKAVAATSFGSKGIAPTAVATSADGVQMASKVASGVGKISVAWLPLASTAITLFTFAYGKYTGSGTNNQMTAKWGMRGDQGRALSAEECKKYIGWFAYDGLKQMTETLGKLEAAHKDVLKMDNKYNQRPNLDTYLELVDKVAYLEHRNDRTQFYADMLSAVAKKWQEMIEKEIDKIADTVDDYKYGRKEKGLADVWDGYK